MNLPMFDIFLGTDEKDAEWLEAAPSLWEARQRMQELAAKSPGQYFVFSQESRSVVARSTRKSAASPSPEQESESA